MQNVSGIRSLHLRPLFQKSLKLGTQKSLVTIEKLWPNICFRLSKHTANDIPDHDRGKIYVDSLNIYHVIFAHTSSPTTSKGATLMVKDCSSE